MASPNATADATVFDNDIEDADHLNEVIMAIDLRDRGTVGCCYYVAMEEKLYLMEDVKHGGLEIVQACKTIILGIQPSLAIDFKRVSKITNRTYNHSFVDPSR